VRYGIVCNVDSGLCSTYGGTGEVHTGFWRGDLRERDHLEDLAYMGGYY